MFSSGGALDSGCRSGRLESVSAVKNVKRLQNKAQKKTRVVEATAYAAKYTMLQTDWIQQHKGGGGIGASAPLTPSAQGSVNLISSCLAD